MQFIISIDLIHCTSAVVDAMARYSASVDEGATVLCLLDFHEMGLDPRNMTYALVEVRSLGSQSQSKSEKP